MGKMSLNQLYSTVEYSAIHPSMNFTMETEQSSFRYVSWMSFSLEILLVSLVIVFIEKIPLSKMQDKSIIQKSNFPFVVPQNSALIKFVTGKVSEISRPSQ